MNISICFILASAFLWGTVGIYSKALIGAGLTPDEVVAIRMLGATVYMTVFLLIKDRKLFKIKLSDLPILILLGSVSVFCAAFTYFRAIEASSISVAVILMYTAPFFVMLASIPLFKEKLTPRKAIALIIAFAGCLLVSGAGKVSMAGIVYGLLSGVTFASYSIFGKFALKRRHTMTVTFYAFLFAAITALCVANPAQITIKLSVLSPTHIFIAIAIGFGTAFLPFLLYMLGLKRIEAGTAAVMSTLEPMVAALVDIVIFKQIPTTGAGIGILLILLSVIFINLKNKKKQWL